MNLPCNPFMTLIVLLTAFSFGTSTAQANEFTLLIPGGEGGGWDTTARAFGTSLIQSQPGTQVEYMNLPGNGGGKAMDWFQQNPNPHTIMVNSTPLVVRHLSGVFQHHYKDFTPLAAIASDYATFVVNKRASWQSWRQMRKQFKDRGVVFGGASKGSLDHIAAAIAWEKSGYSLKDFKYKEYDNGGDALSALLAGEFDVLSTGLGEAMTAFYGDQVRIVGVAAPRRLPGLFFIPTLKEHGTRMEMTNWRGLFASPNHPDQAQLEMLVSSTIKSLPWHMALQKYAWQPLLISGDDFEDFLSSQESEFKRVLGKLDMLP